MAPDVSIAVHGSTDVAAARRVALQMATDSGLPHDYHGALGVVVTEAATNMLKHGGGGEIILRDYACGPAPLSARGGVDPDCASAIEIIAIDHGKGILDLARCFEDGYSTAGSPGTGLGAISRMSQFHELYSAKDAGTVLVARVGKLSPPGGTIVASAISIPYPGETICGDAWTLKAGSRRVRLMIADGLGHGLHAAKASRIAVESIAADIDGELLGTPLDTLEKAHSRMRSSRGAAVAVADIDYEAGGLEFVGVGNISCAILTGSLPRRQLVSMNGIVGHEIAKPREYRYPLEPGSVIVAHSDGLSASWSLTNYPGLIWKDPTTIAAVLFRDFRRTRDDATIVVVRQIPDPPAFRQSYL